MNVVVGWTPLESGDQFRVEATEVAALCLRALTALRLKIRAWIAEAHRYATDSAIERTHFHLIRNENQ